jgi:hypothetical protein
MLLPSGALSQLRECERDGNEITDIVLRKGETAAIMSVMTGSTAATSETKPTHATADPGVRPCNRDGFQGAEEIFLFFPL